MIIREVNHPVKFETINVIVCDPVSKKIIHSNHPKYRPGNMIPMPQPVRGMRDATRKMRRKMEEGMTHLLKMGWEVIYRSGHKLLTEQVSVEDLLHNVLLGSEKDGRWSVFSKNDDLVFAQQMTNGKVCSEDEQGKKTYYADIKAFLESIPEYVLDGVIDDEEKGEE